MTIYFGADHRGFELKNKLLAAFKAQGYEVVDMGAPSLMPDDDYVDYAAAVAKQIAHSPEQSRGVVICGSGFGVDIVVNKFDGARSGLAMSPDHIFQGRHDDNVNVLTLAADFVDEETALKIVKVFLTTPFAQEDRYRRRLAKIAEIELDN